MHWLIWLSVGIVLGILELFTPGFFLVGVGVSMAIAAIPAALSYGLVGPASGSHYLPCAFLPSHKALGDEASFLCKEKWS